MRGPVLGKWLSVLLLTAGCPFITDDPSKEDAAQYFGLADGRELTFEVTDGSAKTTAKHVFTTNEGFAGRLAFTRVERNAANILVDTLVLEADLEELRLLRTGDCIPNCKDYATPPVLLKKPMPANVTLETITETTLTGPGGTTAGPQERHQVTISDLADVVTPAGTFQAHAVLWRVFVAGQAPVDREMYFAQDKGFIQIKQGSATYKLKSGVDP